MYPFKPLTKLGHHLVDGLLIDALLLRTAPFESGHITGHSTPLHAPSASVQQHIETFLISRKNRKMIVACIKRVCGRVAWTWTLLAPFLRIRSKVQRSKVQSPEVQRSKGPKVQSPKVFSCSNVTVSIGYKGEHRLFIAVFKRTTKGIRVPRTCDK